MTVAETLQHLDLAFHVGDVYGIITNSAELIATLSRLIRPELAKQAVLPYIEIRGGEEALKYVLETCKRLGLGEGSNLPAVDELHPQEVVVLVHVLARLMQSPRK